MSKNKLSHVDARGRASMVDVGDKEVTSRRAVFEAWICLSAETFTLVEENRISKGDVLSAARIAGIMAAKKTWELIPLCHPVFLDHIDVGFDMHRESGRIRVWSEVGAAARTGVEMEALVAVQTACMTIYDMCKAVQRDISIKDCRLVHKSGGRSGVYDR
ncbi:MAG: cyclic pyranopterin monophosphate synthase MoaC [Desulfonatronovibrionaceae bacterium]